ncbi:UDP-N-acetylglucosamine 1-carboxyvinyltransferase [Aminomonas paucivorans]|uniref:UDP-N-acetylglucosamine 1-carboxyvinyltransferase n=1 Tax=Aminomonas paucivorans TaxID=81412 RepID=UPI0033322087
MENGVKDVTSRLVIQGGTPLRGSLTAQGAKNAALPVMASALLLKGRRLTLDRVPNLHDIHTMADLLRHLGVQIEFKGQRMTLDVPENLQWETPSALVRKMRASSLVLGPLIARCGRAILPLPGGCAIGSRPMDFHLKGLAKMGASFDLVHGAVHAETPRLRPGRIYLDFPSVGATENLLMAAVLTEGETIIENAAREPEIVNLAETLRAMGAQVEGEGSGTLRVEGQKDLQDAEVRIIPDRIEASTYLLAGVITRGRVTVKDIVPDHIEALLSKLEEAGVGIQIQGDSVTVQAPDRWKGVSLKTLPYPGFPTDLQPQIMATLTLAEGTSVIHESVFDARFLHVGEFKRMGAKIELQGNTAVVTGVSELVGADVHASDLRAGAALVLLGLAARDETTIHELGHIWRGYEGLVEKLRALGANVVVLDASADDPRHR